MNDLTPAEARWLGGLLEDLLSGAVDGGIAEIVVLDADLPVIGRIARKLAEVWCPETAP